MKKIILILFVFCTFQGGQSQTSGYYYNLITFKQNNEEAFVNFDKAIKLDTSGCAFLYQKRALLKFNLEDYSGAIADLDLSLSLKDNCQFLFSDEKEGSAVLGETSNSHSFTYSFRGSLKYLLEDFIGSIADCNQAIKLDSKNSSAFTNRGDAKMKLGDLRGAILDYSEAIELEKNNAPHYYSFYQRAHAKDKLGDFRGAIFDYSKALAISPNNANGYYYRANVKSKLQDYVGAIDDYTKAIKIKPKDADFYANRGLTKLQLNQKNDGCLDLSKAGELGDENAYELIRKFCN